MLRAPRHALIAAASAGALLLSACGGDDATSAGAEGGDRPLVVVSASLLGDVVENLAGDVADVEVLIPAGVDPHEYQLSAQQAARLREADAVVLTGGGFEEGLVDVVESAESDGVPTYEALDAVAPIEADEEHAHEGGEEDAHEEEERAAEGEDAHDHGDVDPHFFTDPLRTAEAARAIAEFLSAEVEGIDAAALEEATDAYVAQLEALHADVEGVLAAVPDERRVLVTNHDVLAYFADRYSFEVVGVVVPGTSTGGEGSGGELAALARTIRETGVPAIFADSSAPDDLARTLADEAGDVEVVSLFTESLGEEGSGGETYLDMVRTNAERIAEALGSAGS